MGYVLVGLLLLAVLVAAGLLLRGVNKVTDASAPFAPEEDETAAGDTPQHSEADAEEHGGTGGPTSGPHSVGRTPSQPSEEPAGRRYSRDVIGGEAEAGTTAAVDDHGHGMDPGPSITADLSEHETRGRSST